MYSLHRLYVRFCCCIMIIGVSGSLSQGGEETPRLLSATKIWDQGAHNAFTDLIRWRDRLYCTFREGDAHVGGDGKIRVLASADGKAWKPEALIEEKGVDLRDPKLSITPDDRLMIVAGGSIYEGTKILKGRQPRVSFSKDGKVWTAPQRILTEGEWLWRVTWHEGKAYGVSYNADARKTPEAKEAAKSTGPVPPGPADWKLKLFVSSDGVKYDLLTHLDVPGHPNETTLRFLPGGELMAMVRREAGTQNGWIGVSKAPFKQWSWHETGYRFGGPNFLAMPDGSLWGTSRLHPGGPKTALVRMGRQTYDPLLILPSGGDTSYAGMVWHDNILWVSYYSSHEKKAAIYLARVAIPPAVINIGTRRELFVDTHLLATLRGDVRRKLHQPTPAEVVLTADKPWEGNTSAYFTVLQDGQRYRMYYRGSHFDETKKTSGHPEGTCYAESKDGITWTKPNLGLFEFNGSKENNIVWAGDAASHNFTPFIDTNPNAPAGARFKALGGNQAGLIPFQSADGIRWKPMSEKPVITQGAFDSQNLAFWDPTIGKYREYHRAFRTVRDIMTSTSDDFQTWTTPTFLEYPGAASEQLYTNTVRPYPRAPHLLIGFPTRFLPAKQQTEPIFMSSRDGLTFQRWPEAVIPLTAPKDRDGNRSNYMANGLVSLPNRPGELSVYATEAYYTGTGSRLRRFTYRIDGFTSVHAGEKGGEVLTHPFRFEGHELSVNYRTAKRGTLRIEIQDAEGKPLDGFTLQDCYPLQGDSVHQLLAWKSGRDVSSLAGKAVRFRISLVDGDLFSFQFIRRDR